MSALQRRGTGHPVQQIVYRWRVISANRFDEPRRIRIRCGRRWFACHVVGPLRALVYPLLDRPDLVVGQRPGGRHLLTEGGADQPLVELAAFRVPGADIGLRAAPHRVRASIESKPAQLLIRTVTADAAFAQDWLNVAAKIDRSRRLTGNRDARQTGGQECGKPQLHARILM